ncbi:MAG: hypothetical protein KVP17_002674 [Porospora cf. gigantea B]|nr:MAG: hypothetical protein KVP17_002674 [Porospora cf. gigantea B]
MYATPAGATGMDSTAAGMYDTPAGTSRMYTAGATVSPASAVSQWRRAWKRRQWYDQEANTLGIVWDGESNSWICKAWEEGIQKLRSFPLIQDFSQETALFDAVLFRLRNFYQWRRGRNDIEVWLDVTCNDMRNISWAPKEPSFVFRVKIGKVSMRHRFKLRDYDGNIRKAWAAARDFRDMFEVSRARELVYHRRGMLEKLSEMPMELRRNGIWNWASENMPLGQQIRRRPKTDVPDAVN